MPESIRTLAPSPKIERLHARDIEILYTLYRLRAMTTQHIAELFYSHITHARRRVRQYRTMRWIAKYPYRRTFYHITGRGLSLLARYTEIPEGERAFKVLISRARFRTYARFVDLAVTALKHGWDVEDSRVSKTELALPDSSYLQGTLITPSRRIYPVYVLSPNAYARTVYAVLREVQAISSARNPKVTGVIVLVSGSKVISALLTARPVLFTIPVHLLPYDYAVRALPCLLPLSEHSHRYGLRRSGDDEFCHYVYVDATGRRVTELLTMDYSALFRLKHGLPEGEIWAEEETASLIFEVTGRRPDKVANVRCENLR